MLGTFNRCLPVAPQLLRLAEDLPKAAIVGGDAFAQRVERRNIVSQPARNCFAIGETDIAVHFGTSGSQARHIVETVTRQLRSIVPGLPPPRRSPLFRRWDARRRKQWREEDTLRPS